MTTSAIPTDHIPVEITVRIGRRKMTVSELSAIKENDVLTLDQSIEDGVEICVGEQIIAHGELATDEAGSILLRVTRAGGD